MGVDVSASIVDSINQGRVHIAEPGLDVLVKSAIQSGNLTASLEPESSDVFIIAVPTPLKDQCDPDLSYIETACRKIAGVAKPGDLVILESTSPVGTTQDVVVPRLAASGLDIGRDILVAYCPERVLPGHVLAEIVENDRIVGGINEASTAAAAAFYGEFVSGEVLQTDAATAELVKLTENCYRDVNIGFANELSFICDKAGVNPWELISLANRHPRVNILEPGPGVGGHCIAVDPWFIISRLPAESRLIRTAREVNTAKPGWVVEKVRVTTEKFKRPTIACLGLAFKADIDDLRQSPAVEIVRRLRDEDLGLLLVCEPYLTSHPEFELTPWKEAVEKSDIVLLLVNHKQFRSLNASDLKEKVVIDTRGVIR